MEIPKLFESIPVIPKTSFSKILFSTGDYNRLRVPAEILRPTKTYNLDQWLLVQKNYWLWDIVNSNNGSVVGFGEDGKFIFKQIAQKLRSLHLGRHYCGSLFESISISHDLNVTFSTFPIEAKDDTDLRQGIMIDTILFRSLVAKMIANENELSDKKSKLQLSKGILLFFSEIFMNRGKGLTHEQIENSINKEFPDICAKLLDCLMRNLNHPPSFGGCKLVDLFEKKPMGLYTRPYGINQSKGG